MVDHFLFIVFQLVVVMDYADGELYQILEDDGTLPEDQVSLLYYLCLLCMRNDNSENGHVKAKLFT